MRTWGMVLAAAVVMLGCGGTPPAPSAGGPAKNVGNVTFLSSQGHPVNEQEAMRGQVLAGFNGTVDLSSPIDSELVNRVLAEHQAGKPTADVLGALHGAFPGLQAAGALEDLTPLLQRLEKDRQFDPALVNFGKLGTQKQYYIPWIQATYMLAFNKKALPYLPKGADVNNLTYDQLVAWGESIQRATGEKKIGLPAQPGAAGGLINRFLQGFAYPSYTGAEVTGFKSADAVQMWTMLKRLWAVTNPQSTGYFAMQDPLQSGEVWVAWDHQARIKDALNNSPDQFQVAAAPRGPKGRGYMTAVAGLAIPKGAPDRAAAEALIDYLTRAPNQVKTGGILAFFPVLQGVNMSGTGVPTYLRTESTVASGYAADKKAIAALLPVGLGSLDAQFSRAYQDSFTEILLRNQDPQAVLNAQGAQLQALLDQAKAPCWPPDPPSTGPCRVL
jgi:multiple sugar transport system substrate-binding protein